MAAVITELGFTRLHMLGLISNQQHDAAMAHPYAGTLASGTDPAEYLIWMVRQEILTYADLESCANHPAPDLAESEWQERAAIIEKALHILSPSGERDDRKAYDALLNYGLITDEERAIAMRTPTLHGFPDLACALMWMLHYGAIREERWNALRALLQEERAAEGASERALIVEQAHESWESVKVQRIASGQVSRRSVSSTGILAVVACGVLLAGGFFVYHLTVTVPGCTDSGTVAQVNNLLEAAMPYVGGGQRANFALTQVKEVGYASAHRQRGCTATVMLEKEAIPYAFVVGPIADNYGKLGVSGADRSIVEARFSHIRAGGQFASHAEPIGRERLAAAIQEELAARRLLHSLLPSSVPSPMAMLNNKLGNHVREVSDVEPLDACRELKAGKQYACNLIIEHNDLPFGVFGVRAQILQGEFTFVRDAVSNEWRVSDDFGTAFELARRNARAATFSGNRAI